MDNNLSKKTPDLRHSEFITPGSESINSHFEQSADKGAEFSKDGLGEARRSLESDIPDGSVDTLKTVEPLPEARTDESVVPLATEEAKGKVLADILNDNREVNAGNVSEIMNKIIGQ